MNFLKLGFGPFKNGQLALTAGFERSNTLYLDCDPNIHYDDPVWSMCDGADVQFVFGEHFDQGFQNFYLNIFYRFL